MGTHHGMHLNGPFSTAGSVWMYVAMSRASPSAILPRYSPPPGWLLQRTRPVPFSVSALIAATMSSTVHVASPVASGVMLVDVWSGAPRMNVYFFPPANALLRSGTSSESCWRVAVQTGERREVAPALGRGVARIGRARASCAGPSSRRSAGQAGSGRSTGSRPGRRCRSAGRSGGTG